MCHANCAHPANPQAQLEEGQGQGQVGLGRMCDELRGLMDAAAMAWRPEAHAPLLHAARAAARGGAHAPAGRRYALAAQSLLRHRPPGPAEVGWQPDWGSPVLCADSFAVSALAAAGHMAAAGDAAGAAEWHGRAREVWSRRLGGDARLFDALVQPL
jgi:hypothetical protein